MQKKRLSKNHYEIRVDGALGDVWSDWFGDLNIRHEIDFENGLPVTVIYGEFADQPALFGLLTKIRDLNLTLVSIKKVKEEEKNVHENR